MKNPQQILIVGGTGTLGQPTVKLLSQSGYSIRIMTRSPEKHSHLAGQNVELVKGDLIDASSLASACAGMDTIIVMAHAMLGRGKYTSEKVDLDGHKSLIDCAKSAGVHRMIYMSILGTPENNKLDFWKSKYIIEQYLIDSGMIYTIIRAAAFMETHVHMLLGKGILKNGKALIFGKGENPTNFVSVADIGSFIKMALENPSTQNRVIEFGGPDNMSKNEIAKLYGRLANKKLKFTHLGIGFLKVMSKIMKPIHPGIARIMTLSIIADETDQTYTISPEQKEFNVPLTSIEDFVSQQVARENVRA